MTSLKELQRQIATDTDHRVHTLGELREIRIEELDDGQFALVIVSKRDTFHHCTIVGSDGLPLYIMLRQLARELVPE